MRSVLFVLAISILCGCQQSEDQQVQQVTKSVHSWNATLLMVQKQWHDGAVTSKYVRQMASAARKELATQRGQLDDISSSQDRATLQQQIAVTEDQAQALEFAVSEGRRT